MKSLLNDEKNNMANLISKAIKQANYRPVMKALKMFVLLRV